jgi:hypothetical protein
MRPMRKQIPEIPLHPRPVGPEAIAAIGFPGNLSWVAKHKLGGEPEWLQDDEWPLCCEADMTFYAQLGSIGTNFNLGKV